MAAASHQSTRPRSQPPPSAARAPRPAPSRRYDGRETAQAVCWRWPRRPARRVKRRRAHAWGAGLLVRSPAPRRPPRRSWCNAQRPTTAFADKLLGALGVRMRRVRHRGIRGLAARPPADDEQVARLVQILNQLVRQIAVETQHVPPNRLRDLHSFLRGLSRKPRFPDRINTHLRPLLSW